MEKKEITTNDMKWGSISLFLNDLKNLIKKNDHETLNNYLFKSSFAASCKYDGTNVGKDDKGTKYGRNQTIITNSYQKVSLDQLDNLNVKAIKEDFLNLTGIESEKIERFNLYGELMCNSNLYDYSEKKISKTHQLFGAILKPSEAKFSQEISEKISKANFASRIEIENEEEDSNSQAEEEVNKNSEIPAPLISIYMNEAFRDLISKHDYPHVPFMNHFENFYDLAVKNFEFLKGGFGEGIVLVSPAFGANCRVSKWKNGMEASGDNQGTVNKILLSLEEEETLKIFGENVPKLKELCEMFLKIESSRLICGKPKEEKPEKSGKKEGAGKNNKSISISLEEMKVYEPAIKSAKTKFDHEDTFFAKGTKGMNEYIKLIAAECLNDITIGKEDVEGNKKHLEIVEKLIKEDFINFNRNKKGKK